jgi:hypothetical protein
VAEVVLAEGEAAGGLASMVGTLLAKNVERSHEKFDDFRRLNTVVLIEVSDLGQSVTLGFDRGRCTVHTGLAGSPAIVLRTDSDTFMALGQVRIGPLGLPNYLDASGRAVLRAMATGRLRIHGLRHVRTLNRITRLFSVA